MSDMIEKVYNVHVYYMVKPDKSGNRYRFIKSGDLVSNIDSFVNDVEDSIMMHGSGGKEIKVEYDRVVLHEVAGKIGLKKMMSSMRERPNEKWEIMAEFGPDEVNIEEQPSVDLCGNIIYCIWWFKDGEDVTARFMFWRKWNKGYDRTNCYLTDEWLRKFSRNNNLRIVRTRR